MMKITLKVIIVLLYLSYNSYSQNLMWAKNHSGKSSNSVCVDKQGNIFTIGEFFNTVDFDSSPTSTYTLTSKGYEDIYLLKTDSAGNFLWAKSFGAASDDYGLSLATDDNGDVYFTGIYTDSVDFDPSPTSTYKLYSNSFFYKDAYIAKLDGAGNFIFAKSFGRAGASEACTSLTLDKSFNIWVTGTFNGTIDFDPSSSGVFNIFADTYGDAFVLKLDKNGNFVWAGSLGKNNSVFSDLGTSITSDQNKNVYITGNFAGSADFDPSPTTNFTLASGNYDVFVVKLDSLGTFKWAKKIGSPYGWSDNAVKARDIVVDGAGNVYSTGHFQKTIDFDPSLSANYLLTSDINTNYTNVYISKLDNNGNFVWAKNIGGTLDDIGSSIAFTNSGNVIVAGEFRSGPVDFDPSPSSSYTLSTNTFSCNTFICELTPSGNFVGAKNINNIVYGSQNTSSSLFTAPNDVLYLSGKFNGTIDFDFSPSITYSLSSQSLSYESGYYSKYCISPTILSAPSVVNCKPTTFILNANASSGNIKWYATPTSTTSIASGNVFLTPTLSNTTTYYVESTHYNCTSARVPIIATILNQTYNSNQIVNRCSNSNFQFNNHTYSVTGTYKDTLISSGGCDSIITTQLTMIDTFKISQTFSICPGSHVTVGSHTYSVSGNYQDILSAIGGCDSILYTNLFIYPLSVVNKTITICAGDLYHVGLITHNISGTYSDTLTTIHGCDSIINSNLIVIPAVSFSQNFTIYSGQSVNVGSYTHSATGVYNDTLVAYSGCDSIVTTNLTQLAYQVSDEEWYVVHPNPNSNALHSIIFTDNNNGIAVGETGSILKTSNAGNTWENKNVSGKLSFMETFFVNVNIGYAVGVDLDFKDAIIKTTDGGNTWINQSIGYNAKLTSVYFLNQDTGFAVGYFGTILKTLNGGLNWTVINSGTSNNLHSIVFTDALTGFIVGDGTLLKTTNGGISWQLTAMSGPLRKITFLNSGTGFILSTNQIMKTVDGGLNWTMILNSTNNLTSLHIVNANLYFAIGYFGAIYKTINGGSNWTTTLNSPSGAGLNSIYFTDINHGYVACTGGRIFRTTNSGVQWSDTINPHEVMYQSVCFADTNIAYATTATGEIRKITNGGATIQTQNSGLTSQLNSINFIARDTGIIVGAYNILKTVDGGVNWQVKFNDQTINFFSLDFSNSMNGYAVGMGGSIGALIYKTNDGGETWTSAVTPSANPLFDVDFPTQSIGYAVGGMQFLGYPETSLILKTVDGGNTWSTLPISHSYAFNAVDFVNQDTGFVAGRYGYIFKTVNGGNTWQQLTPNFLGSIFKMTFINSTVGYVCGQDGNMAKTTDGGTTWNRVLSGTNNYLQSLAFDNTGMGYGVGYSSTLIKNGMAANYSDFTICEGDSLLLIAERSGGLYPFITNWSNSSTSNSIQVKPAVTTIYTYTVADGGVNSVVGQYSVTVIPKPVTPVITDLGTVLMSSAASGNQWMLNGVELNGATSQSLAILQNGFYSVIVSQSGCSSDTSLAVQVTTTGEHTKLPSKEIEVFPVPADNYIYVSNSGLDKNAKISLYDSRGIEVFSRDRIEPMEKIYIGNFASGIYLIKLADKNGVYYRKIVKE